MGIASVGMAQVGTAPTGRARGRRGRGLAGCCHWSAPPVPSAGCCGYCAVRRLWSFRGYSTGTPHGTPRGYSRVLQGYSRGAPGYSRGTQGVLKGCSRGALRGASGGTLQYCGVHCEYSQGARRIEAVRRLRNVTVTVLCPKGRGIAELQQLHASGIRPPLSGNGPNWERPSVFASV